MNRARVYPHQDREPSRRRRGVTGAVALAALLLLATNACVASGAGASPSPTATVTQGPIPSDKQARIDYLASLQAIVPSNPPSKGPDVGLVTLPPSSEAPYSPYSQAPAGDGFIVQSDLGPPGQSDAVYTNDWYETTSNGITEVYAGGQQSDPDVGFVDVITWDSDHANILNSGEYETPRKAGPVTITAASGDVLTLTTPDSSTFEFDVSALGYK